jgi:hypothetical protein
MASNPPAAAAWQVPDGAKFVILAVETSSLAATRDGATVLTDNARVLFRPPIPTPDILNNWFGSLRVDQFQRSNLFIVVSEPSVSPGVLDDQTIRLETRAKEVFLGVLLQGAPFGFRSGVMLSGDRRGSVFDVRQVTNVEPIYPVAGAKAFRLSEAKIPEAGRIAVILRDRVMAGGFRRLRGGFASWHAAVLEKFPGERLHEFVRSLDGVMILKRREGERMFRRLGQILIGRSNANEQLLSEMYRLRNATSHLNDFERELGDYPAEGRNVTALLRAFQAEILATEVYRRILSNDELLEKMKDDDSIEGFWDLDEPELRRLWGDPIDLETPCRERFTDPDTRQPPDPRLITRTPGGSAGTSNPPAHNPERGAGRGYGHVDPLPLKATLKSPARRVDK